MAQHDYVIANGTGAAVRSDLNNALAAIVSQNSGATTPSTTYAYQWWADTTTGFLKLRNSANSAWITLFQLDGEWSTIALENGTAAAPSIYFKDSGTDTGFYSPGANQVGISTGGTARLTIDANGNVDIDSNTLYVDATNNRVGLGTSSASSLLHLSVATAASDGTKGVRISNPAGTTAIFECGSSNDSYIGTTSGSDFSIRTNNTPRIYVTNGGNVGIGATTVSDLLHLRAATTPHLRIDHTTTSSFGAVQFYEDTTQQASIGALGSTSSGVGGGNALQIWNFLNAPTVFATNNQERARIDSSGRLLVGTTTAGGTELIQVQGVSGSSTAPGGIALRRSSISNTDDIGFINFTNASGNVHAQIKAFCDGTPGASDYPGALTFSTTADGASSPTERMRINNKGFFKATTINAYVNDDEHEFVTGTDGKPVLRLQSNATSGNQYGLLIRTIGDQNDATRHFFQCLGNTSERATFRSNGGLANYSANNVNLSDRNVKKDIAPVAGTWDCLKEWEIVNFRYKDQSDEADLSMGVIAQQVAESCPEVITVFQEAKEATEDQPAQEERIGVKEQQMMWMAIKALQEAQLRIETLEAEVAALKGV
jgi:hypothetical protein